MISDNITIIFALLICIFSKLVNGVSITDIENVLETFFSPANYNREIRGKLDQSQTLDVNLSFALKNIKKLDEIEETIEVFATLFLAWKDERLIWNPNAYNGTDRVYITADKIWRPEITLENPSTSHNFYGDITRILSFHKSNGVASLILGDIFKCGCSIDLTSFPWDKQKCALVFLVWGYSAKEVELVAAKDTIDLQGYQSNGVWTLLSTKVYSKRHPQKSLLVFEVVLQRRPVFFVVNILIPIMTLSVLELFVFIIPIDSGERISFSLTVLLSIAVYMTLISDNLPPRAEIMAAICYLLVFILIQSAFICLLNIVSVALYLQDIEKHQISTFWRIFVHIFGRANSCRRPRKIDKKPNISDENDDAGDEGSFQNIQTSEMREESAISWKEVSKTFDRVVTIFMGLLLCFGFGMYAYHVITGVNDIETE
ncbi:acetylcholine receptor subunit delta-like [Mercenaria mercenaria]|uniref:acetylcholine receptor subunit delta-like n=1 Tax=Mercenaria mercenaria TaxID=6596 RepID=UPI00234F83AA|nr:acetylcholine receptor subunit delta-like [Mercenaria mercenaria]